MRPRIETPARYCEVCKRLITRAYDEGAVRYAARRFCGKKCEGAARIGVPGARPKTHYRSSTPLVARMARELYFVGRLKQHQIGHLFGIGQPSVSRMVSGQVWQQ